ncbi:MAG: hypothetical protein WCI48_12545 [Bacteroidota bacterium]
MKRGKPIANTGVASDITTSSAKIIGTATFDSGYAITKKGICWDTAANPTLLKSIGHSEEGAGIGSFISSVANLIENKKYYYCAYATNEKGTAYGVILSFQTGIFTLPAVTTSPYSNITTTSAICGGNVTNSGNGTVTARGVCWSTSPDPTTADSHTTNGNGTGVFVSNLAGLTANTLYYIRAFATNEAGTAYGNQLSFMTLQNPVLPTVTTTAITNITQSNATSGGNVTSDGGATVSTRGVCWSTSPNPTISNSYTTDGSGTGTFVSNITGLISNTLYYVRAYATNFVGTAYGNEVSFTTSLSCGSSFTINHVTGTVAPVTKTVTYGTVTDIPGETSKCWITSNLGADHQATSVDDATEASAGWYWQFNRKQGYKHDGTTRTPNITWISSISENSDWMTANDPCTLELGTGWRIPTKTEWINVDASSGWTDWSGPWNSGLKMHAGGYLTNTGGSLSGRGSSGSYWSNTQYGADLGCYLYFFSIFCDMNTMRKAYGFSARCVRDY